MDNKEFDKWSKIIVIVILILGIIYISVELRRFNKEGFVCLSNPFVYGAKKITEDDRIDEIDCYCTVTGESFFKTYSFNEDGVTPPTE